MYIFNWKFGGMDFEVPEYISRNYDAKELKRVVRNITKNYDRERHRLPAKDLADGSAHSYDAVKDMEDIAFIEDGGKIVFFGKSDAASFNMYKHNRWRMNGTNKPCLTNYLILGESEPVKIPHSDRNLVKEMCFVLDHGEGLGFLISTELVSSDMRASYEIFDIGKDDGALKGKQKAGVELTWHPGAYYSLPEIRSEGNKFVLSGYPLESSFEVIAGPIKAPKNTVGDLVYMWETSEFSIKNSTTHTDLTNLLA